ncbi:MAG: DNRLRE domain-containing protein [Chitinivibrionales bacterium]|nr:DNRLRE domain-containing protein [Chitinivibrionales bacterium]
MDPVHRIRCNAGTVALLLVLAGNTGDLSAQYQPRLDFGAKFEPTATVLHGAGQSDGLDFAFYTSIMGPEHQPAFYMDYTRADRSPERQREEVAEWEAILGAYGAYMGLQIGLSFTKDGVAEAVIAGEHDQGLRTLARELDTLGRPVFMRIGYEANGFWNGYTPSSYRQAFVHIADLLRAETDRIATVWCIHPLDGLSRLLEFYPGDEAVDWWSVDLFEPKHIRSTKTVDFLEEAQQRGKPVLIGESTPTKVGVQTGLTSWTEWYGPYFDLIADYPVIKGFSYINRDWAYVGGQPTWGNARLEHNPELACRYRSEIAKPIFEHSGTPSSIRLLAAAQSTYATQSSPEQTHHTDQFLRVRSADGDTIESFVRFDLAGLSLGNIDVVRLWLLGNNSSSNDIDATVYALDSGDWQEEALTWSTRPGRASQPIGHMEINDNGKTKTKYVDVTGHVRSAIQGSASAVGFCITELSSSSATAELHSDDFSDGYPPYLHFVHDGAWWAAVDCGQVGLGSDRRSLHLIPGNGSRFAVRAILNSGAARSTPSAPAFSLSGRCTAWRQAVDGMYIVAHPAR